MKKNNTLLTILLLPLSFLYGIVVSFRNLLFDTGILASREFGLPVISVGNITVGGTGKTPHVEYIISLLKDEFKIAVLSRGYKRRSSGFIIVSPSSLPENTGDEPLQIKKKFPSVEVAVSESRVKGIDKILAQNNEIQAIVLDDAFQHRWVRPGISILLIDHNRPLKSDRLLPAGSLRERASAITRAVIILVTKCPPDISPIDRRVITKDLGLFPWQSLYFTTQEYGEPVPVFKNSRPFPKRKNLLKVLMVTGIATPGILKSHLLENFQSVEQLDFPDHHNFTAKDIKKIEKVFNSIEKKQKVIITTEKDAVRFSAITGIPNEIKARMFFIPLWIRFIEKDNKFNQQILNYVRKNKRDHILSSR